MGAARQALEGETLELHAIDGVDAFVEGQEDTGGSRHAELEYRLRGNEFFRDCLATSTVTLKVLRLRVCALTVITAVDSCVSVHLHTARSGDTADI